MVSVLLFPGQGSQKVGMARDLAERFSAARETLEAIDGTLGVALSRVMWEGPEDALQQTRNTQPAVLAHSAAVMAVARDRLGEIRGAAGHSLGEYSAYVAAGTLTVTDGVRLVRHRGELMQQAGTEHPGAMAAVLGLATEAVEAACRQASRAGVGVAVAANLNSPDQTVLSGDPDAVARAGELCKAAGAKRIVALKVGGAFHSPLMAPAVGGLKSALDATPFADPGFPVVANASARPVWSAAEARQELAEQLTAPVRWVECVRALATLAPAARFVEVGPGTVLGGLLKRIVPEAQYLSLGTADQVERFLA